MASPPLTHPIVSAGSPCMRKPGAAVSRRELTTVLTTTMTTVGLPDTVTYTTIELVSCLVAPSACLRIRRLWFESLRAHPLAPPGNHCGLPALSRRGWVTGQRVSTVSPLIVRTPLPSGRHHQRRSMHDAVPAAVLPATTVCLAGSTVTAWVPPSAEITVCAPVLVSMAITVLSRGWPRRRFRHRRRSEQSK